MYIFYLYAISSIFLFSNLYVFAMTDHYAEPIVIRASINDALVNAAEEGNTLQVALLLKRGAKLDVEAKLWKTSALHMAAMKGHGNVVDYLIGYGKLEAINLETEDNIGLTALQKAAQANQTESVKKLVTAGANVNAGIGINATPLHYAALWGNVQCAEILCSKGACVDAQDYEEKTPFHPAAGNNRVEFIKILAKYSYTIVPSEWEVSNSRKRISQDSLPSHKELQQDLVYIFLDELNSGRPLNTPEYSRAKEETVDFLLDKLEKIFTSMNENFSPLIKQLLDPSKVKENFGDLVRIGIEEKCESNQKELNDKLFMTLNNGGRYTLIRNLIKDGARADAYTTDGYTGLHIAVSSGNLVFAEELCENGARVDALTKTTKVTPFTLIAKRGKIHELKRLAEFSYTMAPSQEEVSKTWNKISYGKSNPTSYLTEPVRRQDLVNILLDDLKNNRAYHGPKLEETRKACVTYLLERLKNIFTDVLKLENLKPEIREILNPENVEQNFGMFVRFGLYKRCDHVNKLQRSLEFTNANKLFARL